MNPLFVYSWCASAMWTFVFDGMPHKIHHAKERVNRRHDKVNEGLAGTKGTIYVRLVYTYFVTYV